MDRAYVDYEWLNNLDSTGVYFVYPFKKQCRYGSG